MSKISSSDSPSYFLTVDSLRSFKEYLEPYFSKEDLSDIFSSNYLHENIMPVFAGLESNIRIFYSKLSEGNLSAKEVDSKFISFLNESFKKLSNISQVLKSEKILLESEESEGLEEFGEPIFSKMIRFFSFCLEQRNKKISEDFINDIENVLNSEDISNLNQNLKEALKDVFLGLDRHNQKRKNREKARSVVGQPVSPVDSSFTQKKSHLPVQNDVSSPGTISKTVPKKEPDSKGTLLGEDLVEYEIYITNKKVRWNGMLCPIFVLRDPNYLSSISDLSDSSASDTEVINDLNDIENLSGRPYYFLGVKKTDVTKPDDSLGYYLHALLGNEWQQGESVEVNERGFLLKYTGKMLENNGNEVEKLITGTMNEDIDFTEGYQIKLRSSLLFRDIFLVSGLVALAGVGIGFILVSSGIFTPLVAIGAMAAAKFTLSYVAFNVLAMGGMSAGTVGTFMLLGKAVMSLFKSCKTPNTPKKPMASPVVSGPEAIPLQGKKQTEGQNKEPNQRGSNTVGGLGLFAATLPGTRANKDLSEKLETTSKPCQEF